MKKSRSSDIAKQALGAYILNESGMPRLATAIGLPQEASDPEYLKAVKHSAAHALFPLKESPTMELNGRGPEGDSMLHVACAWGDLRAVRLLIEAGCDIESRDEMEVTPLSRAVNGRFVDIVEFLVSHGANSDTKSAFGYSPREWALQMGYSEIVEALQKGQPK